MLCKPWRDLEIIKIVRLLREACTLILIKFLLLFSQAPPNLQPRVLIYEARYDIRL